MIAVIAVGGTVVFAGALVVLSVVVGRKTNAAGQRRLRRLRAEVAARGWRYEPRNDTYAHLIPGGTGLLQKVRRVEHVITGTFRGRPLFAAYFRLSSGEPQTRRGIGIRLPAPLPRLSVTRATRFENRINGAIGRGGFQTGNPVFDAHYDVETDNARLAADVLRPEMQDWLLHDESARNWGFWIRGDWLYPKACTQTNRVDSLIDGLDALCAIFDRLPETVRGPVRRRGG